MPVYCDDITVSIIPKVLYAEYMYMGRAVEPSETEVIAAALTCQFPHPRKISRRIMPGITECYV